MAQIWKVPKFGWNEKDMPKFRKLKFVSKSECNIAARIWKSELQPVEKASRLGGASEWFHMNWFQVRILMVQFLIFDLNWKSGIWILFNKNGDIMFNWQLFSWFCFNVNDFSAFLAINGTQWENQHQSTNSKCERTESTHKTRQRLAKSYLCHSLSLMSDVRPIEDMPMWP